MADGWIDDAMEWLKGTVRNYIFTLFCSDSFFN
jgi:hypothetical protein